VGSRERAVQEGSALGFDSFQQEVFLRLRTALAELLGIEHPIIQAPMAGVFTPEMAAAVSNAGALGSIGVGLLAPRAIRDAIRAVRAKTERPSIVNCEPADRSTSTEAGLVNHSSERLAGRTLRRRPWKDPRT
jgi:NAD(P)H-dependent flavin oxidoreductase YrpB (nitropropane dioxygenase family)